VIEQQLQNICLAGVGSDVKWMNASRITFCLDVRTSRQQIFTIPAKP
jgi:hypothetical protein